MTTTNPEFEHEFHENKPEEKQVRVYPTSNVFPYAGNTFKPFEADSLGHLARMGASKGTLGMMKYIGLFIGTIAIVGGILFFLSGTGILPNL